MVCRVESGMFYLGTWLTNFTSNTKKYKKTAKIHSKTGILLIFISKSTQAEAATVLLQMYICGQGFTK